MSRIRSIDTQPELILRRFLYKKGLRYRIHYKITGKPDIVFPKKKITIFVNGCFWHQHGCLNSVIPKRNRKFWLKKLRRNVERDKLVKQQLKKQDWKIITVWECNMEKNIDIALMKIFNALNASRI